MDTLGAFRTVGTNLIAPKGKKMAKPAQTVTRGNLVAAIDGTKFIIKTKILAGAKTTVPTQFETKAAPVAAAKI